MVFKIIDRKYGELRPKHYTTSVDLIYGPVVDTDSTDDTSFGTVEGTNIRRESNDIIVLDYAEEEYLSQTFATRTESVTPFLISFWNGNIELTPASDNWVDQERLEAKIIETEGDYAETFNQLVDAGDIDAQTGLGSILWDSWETTWGATDEVESTRTRAEKNGPDRIDRQGPGGRDSS